MPETKLDTVDYQGYALTREQASYLELVIDHGMGARAALHAMGKSMNALSGWLKDETFKRAWVEIGKPMLAIHNAELAQEVLVEAKKDIMALSGDDVKKASALANLARSTADYKFRTAERLAPKDWGPKTQIEGTVDHRAIVFLPELAPLPPAPVRATLGEGAPDIPQLPAHVETTPLPEDADDA